MTDVKTDVVLHEVRDRIATLPPNRPDRLNAWTGGLARRYYSLLEDAAADPDVRVIVVTGAGRGWCAGADMDSLQGGGDSDDPGAVGLDRAIWFPTTIPKPIIAAINGACAGIGLCAALMCDLRFAAAGAKFTTAFVRRGLVAEHGSSWMLPRLRSSASSTRSSLRRSSSIARASTPRTSSSIVRRGRWRPSRPRPTATGTWSWRLP